ncbi:hypothetical protein B0H14DRAFT_3464984 [Mycena olivaceomarginata]|nr:hypothetical protein B0H14DRAFT_3464984 [Mycena olivaceomarginata]
MLGLQIFRSASSHLVQSIILISYNIHFPEAYPHATPGPSPSPHNTLSYSTFRTHTYTSARTFSQRPRARPRPQDPSLYLSHPLDIHSDPELLIVPSSRPDAPASYFFPISLSTPLLRVAGGRGVRYYLTRAKGVIGKLQSGRWRWGGDDGLGQCGRGKRGERVNLFRLYGFICVRACMRDVCLLKHAAHGQALPTSARAIPPTSHL